LNLDRTAFALGNEPVASDPFLFQQVMVFAFQVCQLIVGAPFPDFSLPEQQNLVTFSYGGKSVGNDDGQPAGHEFFHGIVNPLF
jgi:hypothetical protein